MKNSEIKNGKMIDSDNRKKLGYSWFYLCSGRKTKNTIDFINKKKVTFGPTHIITKILVK